MFLVRVEAEKVSRTRCAPVPGAAPCQPHRLGPVPTSPQKDISPCPERATGPEGSTSPQNCRRQKLPAQGENWKLAGFI